MEDNPTQNLDQFLMQATIASLRSGSNGTLAAVNAKMAAEYLTLNYGVKWDRPFSRDESQHDPWK